MDTAVETEGDISKEDFERLKAKYRKEALKLASESERAGYEKGRAETIKATEAQLSAWKTVLSSFESFEGDVVKSGKPDLLVQHVIEQIYKRMKQRFSQRPSDCTLPQVKVREYP